MNKLILFFVILFVAIGTAGCLEQVGLFAGGMLTQGIVNQQIIEQAEKDEAEIRAIVDTFEDLSDVDKETLVQAVLAKVMGSNAVILNKISDTNWTDPASAIPGGAFLVSLILNAWQLKKSKEKNE